MQGPLPILLTTLILAQGTVALAAPLAQPGVVVDVVPSAAPVVSIEAAPPAVSIDENLIDEIRAFLDNDVVRLMLDAHNRYHAGIDAAGIERLDKQWRTETEAAGRQPMIARTLASPLSIYLTQIQAFSLGLFTEIFVVDRFGLNVGQSAITTDFYQGDEAKWQKTVPIGPDAVFIDDAEFHEPTRTWRAQVNLSIADEARTAARGAATIEINLTELARRRAAGL